MGGEVKRGRPPPKTAPQSAFGEILAQLVEAVPGCQAAVFIDQIGEAVDAVGYVDAFDIKVAGAHLKLLLQEASTLPGGEAHELVVTARRTSYRARVLPEGYAIVLMLAGDGAFNVSERALQAAGHAIALEAGFDSSPAPSWFAVEVSPSGTRALRPRRAKGKTSWHDVEVLGAVMGLGPRERGYRVRLGNGLEVTLLREPLGRWWSDEPLE